MTHITAMNDECMRERTTPFHLYIYDNKCLHIHASCAMKAAVAYWKRKLTIWGNIIENSLVMLLAVRDKGRRVARHSWVLTAAAYVGQLYKNQCHWCHSSEMSAADKANNSSIADGMRYKLLFAALIRIIVMRSPTCSDESVLLIHSSERNRFKRFVHCESIHCRS